MTCPYLAHLASHLPSMHQPSKKTPQHRTGCVVASFRKTIGETFENIFAEYHVYAGVKARKLDEAFIDQFDTRTVLWLARENGFVKGDGSESPMLEPVVKRQRTAA